MFVNLHSTHSAEYSWCLSRLLLPCFHHHLQYACMCIPVLTGSVFYATCVRTFSFVQALMYPSLLDHDSPFSLGGGTAASSDGLSYSLVGNKSAYLYFVIGRKFIARLPVAFVTADTPPPPPPFPPTPSPLNPANCSRFTVSDAYNVDVNGVYSQTGQESDGAPVYSKDTTHQLYRFGSIWKLGFQGHEVYYEAGSSAQSGLAVPELGWGGCGVANVLTVTCSQPAPTQTTAPPLV